MTHWLPIRYRDFWDVPRIFLVQLEGQSILFDCRFDEVKEDYPDRYQIYLLPALTESELAGSWDGLADRASHRAAEIAVSEVRFDQTSRQAIDGSILDKLMAKQRSD